MNLLFISHGLKDPEAWRLALGVEKFIHFTNPDKPKGLAEISLMLDTMIWMDRYPIDWVLYCNNEKGIKWSEFQTISPYIDVDSDTILLTQTKTDRLGRSVPDLEGNFYCRPHVFTMLGNTYKIENELINNLDAAKQTASKIFFSIARGGYNIKLI
jgi:hypothetical protein